MDPAVENARTEHRGKHFEQFVIVMGKGRQFADNCTLRIEVLQVLDPELGDCSHPAVSSAYMKCRAARRCALETGAIIAS